MGRVDSLDTLPWSTDLGFQVMRYTASHQTLTLRHWGRDSPSYELVFTAVRGMELDTYYTGLTITAVREHGRFDDSHPLPLLLLELRDRRDRHRRGFVACSRVGLDEVGISGPRNETRWRLSGVAAPYSELAVGGAPVGPNGLPGQLRTFRRPTPEEPDAG
jgi:hypothetical protein